MVGEPLKTVGIDLQTGLKAVVKWVLRILIVESGEVAW